MGRGERGGRGRPLHECALRTQACCGLGLPGLGPPTLSGGQIRDSALRALRKVMHPLLLSVLPSAPRSGPRSAGPGLAPSGASPSPPSLTSSGLHWDSWTRHPSFLGPQGSRRFHQSQAPHCWAATFSEPPTLATLAKALHPPDTVPCFLMSFLHSTCTQGEMASVHFQLEPQTVTSFGNRDEIVLDLG